MLFSIIDRLFSTRRADGQEVEGSHMSEAPILAFRDREYTRADLAAMVSGMAPLLEQRGVRVALMSTGPGRPRPTWSARWATGGSWR